MTSRWRSCSEWARRFGTLERWPCSFLSDDRICWARSSTRLQHQKRRIFVTIGSKKLASLHAFAHVVARFLERYWDDVCAKSPRIMRVESLASTCDVTIASRKTHSSYQEADAALRRQPPFLGKPINSTQLPRKIGKIFYVPLSFHCSWQVLCRLLTLSMSCIDCFVLYWCCLASFPVTWRFRTHDVIRL